VYLLLGEGDEEKESEVSPDKKADSPPPAVAG